MQFQLHMASTDRRAAVFIALLYCLSSQVAVPPPNPCTTARGAGAATAARPCELGGGDCSCGCSVSALQLPSLFLVDTLGCEPLLTAAARFHGARPNVPDSPEVLHYAARLKRGRSSRAHCPAVLLFCTTKTYLPAVYHTYAAAPHASQRQARWASHLFAKGAAVSSMYFHWAFYHEETNGLRLKGPVGHGTVDGISSFYQYYMERDCHVLMQKYSCWCRSCRRVARRTAGALSASFKVSGCDRTGSYYEWTNKTCGPKSGSDEASPVKKKTQKRGHELAAGGDLTVGSSVLVECFGDKENDMWLGKVVNSVDLDGACKKKYVEKARHIKGTRCDRGGWCVALV